MVEPAWVIDALFGVICSFLVQYAANEKVAIFWHSVSRVRRVFEAFVIDKPLEIKPQFNLFLHEPGDEIPGLVLNKWMGG